MNEPISIVIYANCDASVLERSLPELLAQQYEPGYEVVVVRESKQGDMFDMLERIMPQHPNLHTTFLPDQAQYVTDEEVEILLGTKAATNDNIIVIPATFVPQTDDWLQNAAQSISPNIPVTLGTPQYPTRHFGFFKKRSHRQMVRRILKSWSKANGFKRKDAILPKDQRELYSIAYSRQRYLDDMPFREIIYKHTMP